MNTIAALCAFDGPRWLLLGSNVPSLVYYSHIPAIIVSLFIGLVILLNSKKTLSNYILFFTLIPFWIWVFFNILVWASNRSDVIMFLWSVQILIEPLIYIGMLYLVYVFINKQDAPFSFKLAAAIAYLPLIIIVPTTYTLSAFNLSLCIPDESYYAYYTYILELAAVSLIIVFSLRKYSKIKDAERRKEILYFSTAIVFFLFSFASGNIIGSFTDNWNLAQVGLFGMPIFAGFIAYMMIRFRSFNVHLLAAQVLVYTVCILILSLLFIRDFTLAQIITFLTAAFVFVIGILFIKSTKKEILQHEKIETLAREKTELVSLATHHIGTPLTVIKGYLSMFQEGTYKNAPDKEREILSVMDKSITNMVNNIRNLANVNHTEREGIDLQFSDVDIKELISSILSQYKLGIEDKGLQITLEYDENNRNWIAHVDLEKMKQVITAALNNCIRFTTRGYIKVILTVDSNQYSIRIIDTGDRTLPEIKFQLINKFSQSGNKDEALIVGNDLGLYVAKLYIEAQSGTFKVESYKNTRTTEFIIKLPIT